MLVASAGSLEGIKEIAKQYFYAEGEIRLEAIDGVLRITENNKIKDGFKVVIKGKRVRLETI